MYQTEKQSERKKKGLAIIGVALSGALAVAGISAYFTDVDETSAKFGLGEKVDISIVDKTWAETDSNSDDIADAFQGLVPQQTVTIDPTIKNIADVPAYVAIAVELPIYTKDGSTIALYDAPTAASGWTLKSTKDSGNVRKYTYVYGTALSKNDTAKVCDSVTVANLKTTPSTTELPADNRVVHVKAYAIQSATFTSADLAFAAWDDSTANPIDLA